jgi:N-acyl-D-amino-acid deacylase
VTAYTLENATVVDGSGAAAYRGNVCVEDDRILSVHGHERRGRVLDATGLVVAPGFIDIHSHLDWIAPLPDANVLLSASLLQGITTSITGNCGISPAPLGSKSRRGAIERMLLVGLVTGDIDWDWESLDDYLRVLDERGLPLNLAVFVGASTLRATVLGGETRAATSEELAEMKALLEQGLADGAVGLSVGLEYFPGRYAPPSEVAELARVAAAHDALVAVHTRGISELYDPAMDEALALAAGTRCRLQISHVNPMGRANWDGLDRLFERVDAARTADTDVAFDMIGYVSWTLTAFEALPHTLQDLGLDAVLALARDVNGGRRHLHELLDAARPTWPPWIEGRVTRNIPLEMGWDALVVADQIEGLTDRAGDTIAEIAARRNQDPEGLYFDLIAATGGSARIVNVGYGGDLENDEPLRRLIARPDAIPETDTVPVAGPGGISLPLPLFHGTMARFLGHFSRELELITLEEAVRRITSLPARRTQLADRGVLREQAAADLVVFDPATIGDQGTLLEPRPPSGIVHVFVNGVPVVEDGVYDPSANAGRALRVRRAVAR